MNALHLTPRPALHRWLRVWAAAAVLAIGIVATSLLTFTSASVNAAAPLVAGGTLTACNGEENAPGTGVRCTVTVTNYMTATGTLAVAPASSWTVTRCTGATGVLAPVLLGGATCVTTTLPTAGAPISIVQLCNGSGNGGGGAVWCTTTITNHFAATPAAFTAATVYECVTTVPGMLCSPTELANTALNVPAATIGQCNGSGGGGGLVPAVPLLSPHCAVGVGSTTTVTAAMNVDQCNGSANGGGGVLKCLATVTNLVDAPPSPPPPPAAPQDDEAPSALLPAPVIVPTAVAIPVVVVTPVPTVAVVAVVTPPTATPTAPQQVVPTPTATPIVTPTVTPTATPIPPRPGPTGNGGFGAAVPSFWVSVALAVLVAGAVVLTRIATAARSR